MKIDQAYTFDSPNGPVSLADLFEGRSQGGRWLVPASLLAIAPKCGLCVLAYAGLGAALGLSGPEICGGAAGLRAGWASPIALLGVGLGLVGCIVGLRRCRNQAATKD